MCAKMEGACPNLEMIRRIAHPESHRLLYGRHPGPNDRGIIYVGVCKANDKMYIGLHRHAIDGRSWKKTRYEVHVRSSGCILIHRALQIHQFEWFVLEELPADMLCENEAHWIADLKTQHPNGYNLDAGGTGGAGSWCESSKKKRKDTMATAESKAKRSTLTTNQWQIGDLRKVNADAAEKRLVALLEKANTLAVPDVPNKERVHGAFYRIGTKVYRYQKSGRGILHEMTREGIEAEREAKRVAAAKKRSAKM